MEAFVLIQKAPGHDPVAAAIRGIPGVVSAHDLGGAYDAVALARSRSERDLVDEVLGAIRMVPGVTRALPAPLIRSLRGSRLVHPSSSQDEAA